jgi:ketosteroid isomerase-like protein
MKRLLAAGAIVLLSAGGAAAQPPAAAGAKTATGSVAQALTDLENRWAKASKASDGDAIAALLAEDFVALDADGSLHNKAEVVARTKKAKWTTNEIAEVKIVPHGNAAVVTGSWTGIGTDGAGKAVNAKERWADTWVKTAAGKWQCVASASSPIK